MIKKAVIKKNGDLVTIHAQCIDTTGNEYTIEKEFKQNNIDNEIDNEIPGDEVIFTMGRCYEIQIKTFYKEEKIERLNNLINVISEYLSNYQKTNQQTSEVQHVIEKTKKHILYLENKKKKIESGINVEELEIEYSNHTLEIKWKENEEEKKIEISEEHKEVLFSNLELKIFKF